MFLKMCCKLHDDEVFEYQTDQFDSADRSDLRL